MVSVLALAASGQATEHSYRPALERLFKSIDDSLTVINEPKRLTDVGAPGFEFSIDRQMIKLSQQHSSKGGH